MESGLGSRGRVPLLPLRPQFAPQLGSFEWNYLVDRETGVYVLALRTDVAHPLPPESDEVELAEAEGDDADGEAEAETEEGGDEEAGDEEEAAAADEDGNEPIVIHFDGLAKRVARLPMTFDNYFGLSAVSGGVLVIRGGPSYYGRQSDVRAASGASPSRTVKRTRSRTVSADMPFHATASTCSSVRAAPGTCIRPRAATPARSPRRD